MGDRFDRTESMGVSTMVRWGNQDGPNYPALYPIAVHAIEIPAKRCDSKVLLLCNDFAATVRSASIAESKPRHEMEAIYESLYLI